MERHGDDDYADMVFATTEAAGRCLAPKDDATVSACKHMQFSGIEYNYGKSGAIGDSSELRIDEWKTCDKIFSKGREPSAPVQAGSARPSGSIVIGESNATEMGFALLVARGGDGMDGIEGADSPLCVNHSYQSPTEQNPLFDDSVDRMGPLFDARGKRDPQDKYDYIRGYWDRGTGIEHKINHDFDLRAGPGGQGGNASSGGSIQVSPGTIAPVVAMFIAPGRAGKGGLAGACGPQGQPSSSGSDGSDSSVGAVRIQ